MQELDVTTTAVSALLELGLVLDDERLALGVDDSGEWGGDRVMGSLGLGNEALVANNSREDGGFLDRPLADIAPSLAAGGRLLGSFRRCPALRPVVGELLDEGALYRSRLSRERKIVSQARMIF